MEDMISVVALAIGLSYGTGVLWYNLLGHKHDSWMRVAALPLVGLFIAQGIWDDNGYGGPVFMQLNVLAVVLGTGIAALGDVVLQAIVRESHVAKVVGSFAHLFRGID